MDYAYLLRDYARRSTRCRDVEEGLEGAAARIGELDRENAALKLEAGKLRDTVMWFVSTQRNQGDR